MSDINHDPAFRSNELPTYDHQGKIYSNFVASLPGDAPIDGRAPRQVFESCYSHVDPTPTSSPSLLAVSRDLAGDLGFDPAFTDSQQFADVFSGNALLKGMRPFAMCYGGHQFGQWAGQLGDGRAINLGERISTKNNRRVHLQLKGAGPTPYSRHADGRAVLRSSLREYICSEAMHHLGVPTTRALSIALTGDSVERDMFYDGNAKREPGAVVCRVSESFLRFGSLEIFSARQDYKRLELLVAYLLENHYPACFDVYKKNKAHGVVAFFEALVDKSAFMVSEWMRVGFVHGVVNTDNMSLIGETIDYGPYGWLDNFDRDWTPNTTDRQHRRYRYAAQPGIVQWNLLQLANAIFPLVNDASPLENAVHAYSTIYNDYAQRMMSNKLGLYSFQSKYEALIESLETVMQDQKIDFTAFYSVLTNIDIERENDTSISNITLTKCLQCSYLNGASALSRYTNLDNDSTVNTFSEGSINALRSWLNEYLHVRKSVPNTGRSKVAMQKANPRFTPRNFIVQEIIDAASINDYAPLHDLMDALQTPYHENAKTEQFQRFRPDWALEKAGCSMLSCSS